MTERIDGRGIVQDLAANGVAWAFDLLECEQPLQERPCSCSQGDPFGSGICSQPRLIVRCSHSACTTRVTDIGDVDVASACLAGPLSGGLGLSKYFGGAGPWDHGCRFVLAGLVRGTLAVEMISAGLVPGTSSVEINMNIAKTSRKVMKML